MREDTIVFLMQPGQILLAMKKRGFGEGKFNGTGGKVGKDETVEQAAVREAKEEISVDIKENDLNKVAHLKFYFNEHPDWNISCHTFFVHTWNGEPTESEEMAPQWFSHEQIPFEQMWIDDVIWLPRVLAGEKLDADFYFNGKGESIDRHEITPWR